MMKMRRIKPMIYRQWMLERKNLFMGAIVLFAILLIITAVALSMQFGNLKEGMDGDTKSLFGEMGGTIAMYMICYVMISVASISTNVKQADIKANWTRYAIALPGTPSEHAFAFTAFLALRLFGGYAVVTVIGLILGAVLHHPLTLDFIADMVFMSLIMLAVGLVTVMFFTSVKDAIRFKKRQTGFSIFLIVCGSALGLLGAKLMPLANKATAEEGKVEDFQVLIQEYYLPLREAVKPFLIPAVLGMLLLIYLASRREYAKQKQS